MLVAFHERAHSHVKSIDRVNEPIVKTEPGLSSCTCLAWDCLYRSSKQRRKKKKNQILPAFLLGSLFLFPFCSGVSCLFYTVRLCCVYFFKVCKRRCLEGKYIYMTAAMYAFPCDATRVHRGALSPYKHGDISPTPSPIPYNFVQCNL